MITVMRGTITRTGRRPSVEIPDLGVGYDFGPCETISSEDFERGDRVLVASVGDIPEDVVVLGRMSPEDEDEFGRAGWLYRRLDPRYAGKYLEHDVEVLEGRVSELEGDVSTLQGQVSALQSGLAAALVRITALEAP